MNDLVNFYVRVSSSEQGDTRLGIDAQLQELTNYAKAMGLTLNETFIDIKSAKDIDRPNFIRCIENSKANGFKMLVAKSCRLSRDIADGFNIRKLGVDIKILDTNIDNTMEFGIRMVYNQHEREEISRRTKQALAQLKLRGVVLGKPENFTNDTRAIGREVMSDNAKNDIRNKQATNLILIYRDNKLSYDNIANKLNDLDMVTRRGNKFNAIQVKRLYDRAKK